VIYGTESLGGSETAGLAQTAEVLVMKKGPTRTAMLEQTMLFLRYALRSPQPTGRALTGPTGGSAGAGEQKNPAGRRRRAATCSR